MKILKAGNLLVKIYPTRQELGEKAAQEAAEALKEVIREKGEANVIFAAAPSQNEFLEALCHSDVDWTKVHAFHMDEYIGLPKEAPQGFGNFLKRSIFDKVPFKAVEYINGQATDIPGEIARYSRLLEEHPVDIVFMGIGENGHIAFNDPAVCHFDDQHLLNRVALDEICRNQQVHDGCFASLEEVPTHALTLTPPALFRAGRLFCMVPGATKTQAVTKTVLGEIREMVPATIMRLHHNAILYVDALSGKDLVEQGLGKEIYE